MAETGRRKFRGRSRLASSWRSITLNVCALLGLLCVVAATAIAVFDLTPIVIRSDSMAPEVNRGDLVVARETSAGDVAVGDVISVKNSAGIRVTHRVETVDPFGSSIQFTLKGDANDVPDAQVYNETSIDKVISTVPKLGYAMGFAVGPIGIFVGGLLVAALAWVISSPWRRANDRFDSY